MNRQDAKDGKEEKIHASTSANCGSTCGRYHPQADDKGGGVTSTTLCPTREDIFMPTGNIDQTPKDMVVILFHLDMFPDQPVNSV